MRLVMPELEHPPHEKFAMFLARGNHVLSAFVAAGYPRNIDMARSLAKQPSIKKRVAELLPIFHAIYRTRVSPQTILRQRREENEARQSET
jgi:hypothetical protein